ncbi:hypothetical protein BZG36_03721 [Bifiguratus adelaidae]|uniref:Uncharacterized protein n=1 Tax=Bifiguratus adelaidae TaxID=1938954 RepID=A0A261XZ61_9FUNG|nr:hypothetical protein BZG36_03721 [Bifiguratus adelaidae]
MTEPNEAKYYAELEKVLATMELPSARKGKSPASGKDYTPRSPQSPITFGAKIHHGTPARPRSNSRPISGTPIERKDSLNVTPTPSPDRRRSSSQSKRAIPITPSSKSATPRTRSRTRSESPLHMPKPFVETPEANNTSASALESDSQTSAVNSPSPYPSTPSTSVSTPDGSAKKRRKRKIHHRQIFDPTSTSTGEVDNTGEEWTPSGKRRRGVGSELIPIKVDLIEQFRRDTPPLLHEAIANVLEVISIDDASGTHDREPEPFERTMQSDHQMDETISESNDVIADTERDSPMDDSLSSSDPQTPPSSGLFSFIGGISKRVSSIFLL